MPGLGGRVPGQGAHGCSGTGTVSDCPYTTYRTSDDIIATFAHVVHWGGMVQLTLECISGGGFRARGGSAFRRVIAVNTA